MIECESTVKKWGNSFGVVLPKEFVKENKIGPEDRVRIIVAKIGKKGTAGRLWGKLKGWKASSEELEKFVDKEFDL